MGILGDGKTRQASPATHQVFEGISTLAFAKTERDKKREVYRVLGGLSSDDVPTAEKARRYLLDGMNADSKSKVFIESDFSAAKFSPEHQVVYFREIRV